MLDNHNSMRTNLLKREVNFALRKIDRKLSRQSSWFASKIMGWIRSLSPTAEVTDAFCSVWMFPMFLLPIWIAETLDPTVDLDFHSDLIYSTLNGYLYIRLLDNVMDTGSSRELHLLPASAFFHTEFHGFYQRYFDCSHPFWHCFDSFWLASSEAVMREIGLQNIDIGQFRAIAAKKLCAAKIAVAATCYRYSRPDLLQLWMQFMDRMAYCWQFADDLFDWKTDLQRGGCTYFLSTAQLRKKASESVETWVAREGFGWGIQVLQTWSVDLKHAAAGLHSSGLNQYLKSRTAMLRRQARKMCCGLTSLVEVASVLAQNTPFPETESLAKEVV